ncbi:hypothetical protein [Persephonella sp.]
MKISQAVFGLVLLFFSGIALYGTYEDKNWNVFFVALAFFIMGVIYVFSDLNNYGKFIKTLIWKDSSKKLVLTVSDREGLAMVRDIFSLFLLFGVGAFVLTKYYNGFGFYFFILSVIIATMYSFRKPIPGLFKDGKYLGEIHKASLIINENVSVSKKDNIEPIGKLKIFKNGEEVAKLALTAEGFMELKPDKIKNVFPEISGKIEKFDGETIFRVGNFVLEYHNPPEINVYITVYN